MEGDGEPAHADHSSHISIHSLRMEGDQDGSVQLPPYTAFQSTPSAWRETRGHPAIYSRIAISIHSLRMEGDGGDREGHFSGQHFNPLPPHGGRLNALENWLLTVYFNPLPPHGGRLTKRSSVSSTSIFQSTPSAWRETPFYGFIFPPGHISIHSLRMEGDSKTAQESVFHFAYPCTILQKRMQKTTFCTRKNGFFRKKGEKFGAKPSASFCAPMIRTDTFPLNFSHRISGSSMSMVSFAPICSTFD